MIKTISYENKQIGWRLNKFDLDPMTLLVGVSGVGKTRILYAINGLRSIAMGKSYPGRKWSTTIVGTDGAEYIWEGEFEVSSGDPIYEDLYVDYDEDDDECQAKILFESLSGPGGVIFERSGDVISYADTSLPKLPPEKSLLATLREEDRLKPVTAIFGKIVLSQGSRASAADDYAFSIYQPNKLLKSAKTLEGLNRVSSRVLERLYIAQQTDADLFNRVREQYLEIFPNVEDIRIEKISDSEGEEVGNIASLQIKERGVADWVRPDRLSSGMLRTLLHLCEIILLPKGVILLIDEFENSLGVNCIDIVTEELLNASNRMQFVITSHHPYVINSIGMRYWRLVTRTGSLVNVMRAADAGLGGSSHEAFLQLLNSKAFKSGVSQP